MPNPKYNPENHHRRSIRLKGYDYSQAGAYFVTIVTHGRVALFGEIVDGVMCLNDVGRMVEKIWLSMPERFPAVVLGAYVVMPNHFHGDLVIVGEISATLGQMIGAFKSITTYEYIQGMKTLGWPAFENRIWQRNYYEHIIRNQADADRIESYIESNPAHWDDDAENPSR